MSESYLQMGKHWRPSAHRSNGERKINMISFLLGGLHLVSSRGLESGSMYLYFLIVMKQEARKFLQDSCPMQMDAEAPYPVSMTVFDLGVYYTPVTANRRSSRPLEG